MGKSRDSLYRVEYRTNHLAMGKVRADMIARDTGKPVLTMVWNVKSRTNVTGYGKPTLDNLKTWRDKFNASYEAGGVNFAFSQGANGIERIFYARIVNQRTGRVMAEFMAPAFEVC